MYFLSLLSQINANQKIGNYWIRVQGQSLTCQNISQLAILHYEGAPVDQIPYSQDHGKNLLNFVLYFVISLYFVLYL